MTAASFQNLDFESPIGPLNVGYVPIANALPGWSAYINAAEQQNVLYDAATLGAPFVSLFSTNIVVVEGNYCVGLGPSLMSSVSLSQAGFLGSDRRSLRFDLVASGLQPQTQFSNAFGVFVNGEQLPAIPLLGLPGYSIYGADVSGFSGQDVTLTFTTFNLNFSHSFLLDSVSFSPEPSTWAIFGAVGVLGWAFVRRKRRRL